MVLETFSFFAFIGSFGMASRRAVVLVPVALFDFFCLDYTMLNTLNECYYLLTVRRECIPV